MMKRIVLLFTLMAGLLMSAHAQETECKIRIPSGYRAFVQQETLYRLTKDNYKRSLTGISTTHGFYFNEHCYVGIGIGFVGGEKFFAMPLYSALLWNMSYRTSVSPLLQVRIGSYLGDGPGAYGDLGFGARFASKNRFAVNAMAVFSFFESTEIEIYDNGLQTIDYNPISAGLRIGIEF